MLPSNAADQEKKIDGSNLLIGGGRGGGGFESRASDDKFFIRLIQLSYKTL